MQELEIIEDSQKAIALYEITPAEIAKRLTKYDGLKVIKGDAASYKEVRAALTALVHLRVEVDNRRKQLGENLRKSVTNINQAGKMLIEPTAPYEARFSSELKAEDDRREAIKAEKEAKERIRIELIQERITSIRLQGVVNNNTPSSTIEERLIIVQGIKISSDMYMEFGPQAFEAQNKAVDLLEEALTERLQFEKEEVEREMEVKRLEEVAKKQAATQKQIDIENERIAKEKADLEKEKQAVQEKNNREQREAEIREEERIRAEKEARQTLEREQKAQKEAEEEKQRQLMLRPDKQKLTDFAKELYAMPMPMCDDVKAQKIVSQTQSALREIADDLKLKVAEL